MAAWQMLNDTFFLNLGPKNSISLSPAAKVLSLMGRFMRHSVVIVQSSRHGSDRDKQYSCNTVKTVKGRTAKRCKRLGLMVFRSKS
jgi:hypothetical protein